MIRTIVFPTWKQRICMNNTATNTTNRSTTRLTELQFLFTRSFDSDAILLHKLLESLKSSVALIIDLVLAITTSLEELQSREATDIDSFHLVGSSIDLGNQHLLVILVGLGQLLVDGMQGLAVTAPGSVEENEHVLLGAVGDLLEGLADQLLHITIV